jgi:hypothetical protein
MPVTAKQAPAPKPVMIAGCQVFQVAESCKSCGAYVTFTARTLTQAKKDAKAFLEASICNATSLHRSFCSVLKERQAQIDARFPAALPALDGQRKILETEIVEAKLVDSKRGIYAMTAGNNKANAILSTLKKKK